MTTCCSLQCEKKYGCAKHCFNNVGTYPSEDYSTFGSISVSDKGCQVIHWCGEFGGYKMFEPVSSHKMNNDIIEIPFKVGDTVWKIEDVWHLDDKATWTYHYEKEVVEFMIRSISISCNSKGKWTKKFRICEVRDGKIIDRQRNIDFNDFGNTVFYAKEDAERALKNA